MTTYTPEQLLTTNEVAEWLRISPKSLQIFRQRGTGPKFLKVGNRVRYRVADVEDYLGSPHVTTAEAGSRD